jgi:hypothetical protein
MNILLIVYVGFLSLFIIGFIHYTEEKVNNYRLAMEDYKRALSIARGSNNTEHYTYLQLENENKRLKEQILRLDPIQYEHRNDHGEK